MCRAMEAWWHIKSSNKKYSRSASGHASGPRIFMDTNTGWAEEYITTIIKIVT
jgi:hypothetical protein